MPPDPPAASTSAIHQPASATSTTLYNLGTVYQTRLPSPAPSPPIISPADCHRLPTTATTTEKPASRHRLASSVHARAAETSAAWGLTGQRGIHAHSESSTLELERPLLLFLVAFKAQRAVAFLHCRYGFCVFEFKYRMKAYVYTSVTALEFSIWG